MDESFWILKMPGSETEILSVDLTTGREQSIQLELPLDEAV
ncbi:hypothetical protein J2S04_002648 [Alicyclobacillus tengchongensis]|uniref:Uncharacterized protein n=1 Tax=Alicyclobacillus tolerans TaxID=90970 RepID=A0ABT9LZH9_9BACL|nr:hypothetical protein [Alicyclobacillus tengchongensis]